MYLSPNGYKIPELEDKDFWDSYNFNWLRSDSHTHDGIDSLPVLLANQTDDEDHRLVTDLDIARWNELDGAGATGVNYVLNPNAEVSVTTNVDETDLTLSSETTSPIQGLQSFKLTSQAVAGRCDWEDIISDSFPIDGGLSLQAACQVKTDAGSSGIYTIGVYNVTDAGYETSQVNVLASNVLTFFSENFVPIIGKTYVFRLEYTIIGVAGVIAIADNFFLSTSTIVTNAEKDFWTQGINDNATNIGTNATNIGNNTTAIGDVASDLSTHESDGLNPHEVTKSQIGLSNAENTSDADKPISTATQTALDGVENVGRWTSILAVASDITLVNNRMHQVDTSAARSLTLPAPDINLWIPIKDATGTVSAFNITIATPAAETIDGLASYVMSSDSMALAIYSDGTNYFVA